MWKKHIFCPVVIAEKHVPLCKPPIFVDHYELEVALHHHWPFSKALVHKEVKSRGIFLDFPNFS
jgi:hypothetical protein